MAPANNRFLNSDIMVGLVSLGVAAVVLFALTRDRAFFPVGPVAPKPEADVEAHGVPDPFLSADENKAVYIWEKGQYLERKGQKKEAIELYKQAAQLDPRRKSYWASLGSLYMSQGDYAQSFNAFKEAYDRDSFDMFVIENLGFLEQQRRNDDSARRYYLLALGIQPSAQTDWDEMYHLSHCGQWQKLSDAIHKADMTPAMPTATDLVYRLNDMALSEYPDDASLLANRALMNLRYRRLDAVQSDIDRALNYNPRCGAALVAQAQLYNMQGDNDKAIKAYKHCLAVSPQPVAYAELGALEMQAGDYDSASDHYKMAVSLGADKPSWVDTSLKLSQLRGQKTASKQAPAAAVPAAVAPATSPNPYPGTSAVLPLPPARGR